MNSYLFEFQSITELLPDLLRNKPTEQSGLQNIIVVDRIPQVGPERAEKLKTVLAKLFSKCGRILNEFYAIDDNNTTKGLIHLYLFIVYYLIIETKL